MFTGIIEEVGTLTGIKKGAKSAVLTISCQKVLDSTTRIGDSIAVNGVCLTVTEIAGNSYTADVMQETLKRTNLGSLQPGAHVNLERAMPADGRFGGHIVSGHIDGCGVIESVKREDTAVWYTIQAPDTVMRYIVEKGSIAIDGVSLTVAYTENTRFQVSLIPHTQKETILQYKGTGDAVNLECDIVGKYVEKLCGTAKTTQSRLDKTFLAENGFL